MQHAAFVSVWIALDDVSPENGGLWILPYRDAADTLIPAGATLTPKHGSADSEPAVRRVRRRRAGSLSPDVPDVAAVFVAAHAAAGAPHSPPDHSDPCPSGCVALRLRAGSAVVMSPRLLHRSGPNSSEHPRRAYMPQYSLAPVVRSAAGSELVGFGFRVAPL
jgi:ectoine hydroxylase-related dioxygenase (phytanoyl-CoA dioxygenase family)